MILLFYRSVYLHARDLFTGAREAPVYDGLAVVSVLQKLHSLLLNWSEIVKDNPRLMSITHRVCLGARKVWICVL